MLEKLRILSGKPKDPKQELSTDECFDVLIASFKYSRGEPILQHKFFELISRHFEIRHALKSEELSEKSIQLAVGILQSPRHQMATEEKYKGMNKEQLINVAISELEEQLNELTKGNKEDKKLNETELINQICYYLLYRDYYYILYKPNIEKRSHVKNYVIDNKHIEGGKPFEFAWSKISPMLKEIIEGKRDINTPENFSLSEGDTSGEHTAQFLWNKIQAQLQK